MNASKNINLPKVYKILERYIDDEDNDPDDRLEIYRLLNKLSDTEEFELQVNREFCAYKLKYCKDKIEDNLRERIEIPLHCGFVLKPHGDQLWQLFCNGMLFLDELSFKMARRLAFDINVAFNIKSRSFQKRR